MKKIKSTRDVRVNTVIRVYRKGFGYARLIVIDNTEHFISVSVGESFVKSVMPGDVLDAYLWVDHGASYEFQLEVIGKFEIDLRLVFFKHCDAMKWSAERKCLVASVEMPFRFFMFSVDDAAKVFSSVEVEKRTGMIVSLSDREATVRFGGKMESGSFLKGHITIDDVDIPFMGKIGPQDTGDPALHRVEFTGMSEKERERILDFVLSVYRE
jgi:hypothetical protein